METTTWTFSSFSVFSPCSEVGALAQLQSSSPQAGIQWLQQGKCLLTWGLDPMSRLRPGESLPLSLLAAQMTSAVLVYYHSALIGGFKPSQMKIKKYVNTELSKLLQGSHVFCLNSINLYLYIFLLIKGAFHSFSARNWWMVMLSSG